MTISESRRLSSNSKNKMNTIDVLCLVTDKKYRKMGGDEELKNALAGHEASVKQVRIEDLIAAKGDFLENLENEIYKQNPGLVVLVHKYSDFYKTEGVSNEQVLRLREWLLTTSKTGRVRVLDDPEKIDVLSDRVKTGLLVREMCAEDGFEARGLQWPEFHLIKNNNSDFEFKYPVIVKPVDACATDEAHWMTLITGDDYNTDNNMDFDGCLVQKFHEHFGILYKVYVIGEVIEIVARPSISAKGVGPLFRFNTHKFKAAEGDLSPEKMREAMERIEPFRPLIEEFAKALKEKLQLTWFGADLILKEDDEKGGAGVIDINYMPGFDGIRGLPEKIIKAILD